MNTAAEKPRRIALPLRILLIVLIFAALGWRATAVHAQLQTAREERDRLQLAVSAKQQENEALSAQLSAGATEEKLEEIAREELGLVTQNEYVFYDVSS